MIHQCFVSVLLVLPLFVASDSIPENNYLDLHEHEAKSLQMFNDFTLTYNKQYASRDEYAKRLSIFKRNLQEIDRLNKEHAGSVTFAVNKFADITYEEFVRNYTGSRISPEAMKRHLDGIEDGPREKIVFTNALNDDDDLEESDEDDESVENFKVVNGKVYLPKRIDYRKRKAVTPVKDQGNCGSCWAFSVISNIEGIYAKKHKKLYNLSEQELLDCDTIDEACNGGWMTDAVKELVRLGGVANATKYPYTARQERCRFEKKDAAVKVAGVKELPQNENEIAKQLVKTGPISVAVHASSSFQFYSKGIFDPNSSQCSTSGDSVNHGVTIVGYGVQAKKPFWVLKNSWGKDWGENGYIRITRGKKACAVQSYASTATL